MLGPVLGIAYNLISRIVYLAHALVSDQTCSKAYAATIMIIVGLTGGIATGKSTVTALLRQQGIRVLDCDEIAHDVVRQVVSTQTRHACRNYLPHSFAACS